MKAIVLSFDDNHYLVDNMIQAYNRLWPDHPFIFRVPYQKNKDYLASKYGAQVEMIKSPPEIVKTMQTLVADIPADEWIYWSIDDKYPIRLDAKIANRYLQWVRDTNDVNCKGLVFHRAWALWGDNVDESDTIKTSFGRTLLRRKSFRNFWLHQFYRASVVQDIVGGFDREPNQAKQMNQWVKIDIPDDQRLWVADKTIALYGESSSRGKLLANTVKSLTKNNIEIPETAKRSRQSMYMGTRLAHIHMRITKKIMKLKKRLFRVRG